MDGQSITAGHDSAARVWDIIETRAVEGRPAFSAIETAKIRGRGEAITHAEFLPDGRLVTGARDGSVRISDLSAARLLGFVPTMIRRLLPGTASPTKTAVAGAK